MAIRASIASVLFDFSPLVALLLLQGVGCRGNTCIPAIETPQFQSGGAQSWTDSCDIRRVYRHTGSWEKCLDESDINFMFSSLSQSELYRNWSTTKQWDVCSDDAVRSSLSYGWQLQGNECVWPFNATKFMHKLANQTLTMVGDSIMEQQYDALLAMIAAGGVELTRCDELPAGHQNWYWPRCFFAPRYGSRLLRIVSKRDFWSTTRDFVNASASEACLDNISHGRKTACSMEVFAPVNENDCCYPYSWTSVLSQTDVLLFNTGLWWHHIDSKDFTNYSRMVHSLIGLMHTHMRGSVAFFRSATIGHDESCGALKEGLVPLRRPRKHGNNQFAWFEPRRHEWQWHSSSIPGRVQVRLIDGFNPMSMRVDAHVDCVHWCSISGPLLWLNTYFYTAFMLE
jgi:hypothetical protein